MAACAIVLLRVMHDGQARNGPRKTLRALLTAIVSHVVKLIILDFPLPPVYPWAVRSLTNEMRVPHGRRGPMRRSFLFPLWTLCGGRNRPGEQRRTGIALPITPMAGYA